MTKILLTLNLRKSLWLIICLNSLHYFCGTTVIYKNTFIDTLLIGKRWGTQGRSWRGRGEVGDPLGVPGKGTETTTEHWVPSIDENENKKFWHGKWVRWIIEETIMDSENRKFLSSLERQTRRFILIEE